MNAMKWKMKNLPKCHLTVELLSICQRNAPVDDLTTTTEFFFLFQFN